MSRVGGPPGSGAAACPGGERAPAVSVRIYRPEEHLGGHVTFYYFVDAARPVLDFLYPEWGNVRLALSGDWRISMGDRYPAAPQQIVLYGPTDRCAEVAAGPGRMVGFGMTPLGWQRLIGGDAGSMANRVRDLGDALDIDGEVLRERFRSDEDDEAGVARWNALLGSLLAERPREDPQVIAADRTLRGNPVDVRSFARALDVSERTLHRLCLRAFGFPPKRLLRRQRFLHTMGFVRSAVGDPIESALGPDYFDSPHFYRDFRDFMGMSPKAYFGAPRELMGPAAEAQQAAGVTLSFALPRPPAKDPGLARLHEGLSRGDQARG